MLFYYIRHGDPIYDPDSLTPLGHRQAEALAKRLALYGVDEIYSSTSTRARQTAQPTSELVKKEVKLLDFANEGHAWNELTATVNGGKRWLFQSPDHKRLFTEDEVRALGHRWYEHPAFAGYDYKRGMERILKASDEFFLSLGYEHVGRSGRYKIIKGSDRRVAMFAHQGFGLAFLSTLLDIPYTDFSIKFDFTHTGMTVINFADEGDGYAIPKVLSLSLDSHIYREGLPTKYSNTIPF